MLSTYCMYDVDMFCRIYIYIHTIFTNLISSIFLSGGKKRRLQNISEDIWGLGGALGPLAAAQSIERPGCCCLLWTSPVWKFLMGTSSINGWNFMDFPAMCDYWRVSWNYWWTLMNIVTDLRTKKVVRDVDLWTNSFFVLHAWINSWT